jgi:hypothetical protein
MLTGPKGRAIETPSSQPVKKESIAQPRSLRKVTTDAESGVFREWLEISPRAFPNKGVGYIDIETVNTLISDVKYAGIVGLLFKSKLK